MNSRVSETASAASANKAASGRLFFLDLGGGRVMSANPDGSDLKTIVSEGRKLPDGIVVDVAAGHLYWTNMGNPSTNDGSIHRTLRPKRREYYNHRSCRGHVYSQATPTRQEERQALLVRARRHACDAFESRWFGHRDAGRTSAIPSSHPN
jgi:hypothetical protein